jgi:uncharacterized protein YjbI with pentapeptide repeats
MNDLLYIDQTFEHYQGQNTRIANKEFDGCHFVNCQFSGCDFSGSIFTDCTFTECNLSMAQLAGVQMASAVFKNCKMLGLRFEACSDFLFAVAFDHCALDFSSFARKKMPKTTFAGCSLKEVSFIETDLSQADFDRADLTLAVFNQTQLAGADFTTARNFTIDPQYNPMKKARFSSHGLIGLLSQYDIKLDLS